MPDAETDLARLWQAAHDYLLSQQNTTDSQGVASLSTSYNLLVSVHNELWERWIKPHEQPVELLG